MICDNRNKITDEYLIKFNELLERKKWVIKYNDTTGDFVIYDKNGDCLGSFYDELNKDHNATDWKVAYNNLKSLL